MNVSHDSEDQLSPMPKTRFKTRNWYIELRLEVPAARYFDNSQESQRVFWTLLVQNERVLDAFGQERNIRTLSNASFSYDAVSIQREGRTEMPQICPHSFMHMIKFGTVLRSPIFKNHMSFTTDQHWKPVCIRRWSMKYKLAPVKREGQPKNWLMLKTAQK